MMIIKSHERVHRAFSNSGYHSELFTLAIASHFFVSLRAKRKLEFDAIHSWAIAKENDVPQQYDHGYEPHCAGILDLSLIRSLIHERHASLAISSCNLSLLLRVFKKCSARL